MIIFNDKECKIHDPYDIDNVKWESVYLNWYNVSNLVLIDPNKCDVHKKIKEVYVDSIPKESTLYFCKTSKFPRYKLQNTSFKRCIKVEKSDFQVTGHLPYMSIENINIYYGEDKYWIVADPTYLRSYNYKYRSINVGASKQEKLNYIVDINRFTERNINLIYSGNIYGIAKNVWTELSKILDGTYTHCLTDDALDKIVNNNMDMLTLDDLDALFDMLNSSDKSTVELGLKMLVGYNINETPVTIRLLLYNPIVKNTNAWNSVGVKQIRESCGYKASGWPLRSKDFYAFDDIKTDKDREFSYYVWKKIVMPYIDKQIEDLGTEGLSFKCHAE